MMLLITSCFKDQNKEYLNSFDDIIQKIHFEKEFLNSFFQNFPEQLERLKELDDLIKLRLDEIAKDYASLDENEKSEYDGLKKMFDLLSSTDLKELKRSSTD